MHERTAASLRSQHPSVCQEPGLLSHSKFVGSEVGARTWMVNQKRGRRQTYLNGLKGT